MIVVTPSPGNVKDGAKSIRKRFMFPMLICVWIQCTQFSVYMRYSQRRDAMAVFRFSSLLLSTLFNTYEETDKETLVLFHFYIECSFIH